MNPVEFLTAIVEASVGLLGFTGVVVAMGRDSGSSSAVDRTRMMNLLGWSSMTLGSALISLTLVSAELQPQLVWRASSLTWLACGVPFATWQSVRILRGRPYDSSVVFYLVAVYGFMIAAGMLQLGNVALWSAFWPHFFALAVGLGLGLSQFIRFFWVRLFG